MSKTIRIDLSESGIRRAIRELENYQRSLETKTERLVERLVQLGTAEARASFGSTAVVDSITDGGTGIIEAVGDNVVIMEFGAGVATMENHPLAMYSPHPVKQWEYSRTVGSGEGFLTGRWHFPPGSDITYDRVEPRHGMLDARDVIVGNVEFEARKVFG